MCGPPLAVPRTLKFTAKLSPADVHGHEDSCVPWEHGASAAMTPAECMLWIARQNYTKKYIDTRLGTNGGPA